MLDGLKEVKSIDENQFRRGLNKFEIWGIKYCLDKWYNDRAYTFDEIVGLEFIKGLNYDRLSVANETWFEGIDCCFTITKDDRVIMIETLNDNTIKYYEVVCEAE